MDIIRLERCLLGDWYDSLLLGQIVKPTAIRVSEKVNKIDKKKPNQTWHLEALTGGKMD